MIYEFISREFHSRVYGKYHELCNADEQRASGSKRLPSEKIWDSKCFLIHFPDGESNAQYFLVTCLCQFLTSRNDECLPGGFEFRGKRFVLRM